MADAEHLRPLQSQGSESEIRRRVGDRSEEPTHLDLFSGIGGFALAARWAGFRTVAFCEIDKYCQRVLAKNFGAKVMADAGRLRDGTIQHESESRRGATSDVGTGSENVSESDAVGRDWRAHDEGQTSPERGRTPPACFRTHPDTDGSDGSAESRQQQKELAAQSDRIRPRIHGNIFELDGTRYRGVDLITGGFPCQPFSVAGKRGGASDDRAIWPQMFRVIDEARPAWIVGENVPGIIAMELDNVLSDLERIGYACRTFVIPACAVDARHRRDRVWIIGRRLISDSENSGLEGRIESGLQPTTNERPWEICSTLADADEPRSQGRNRAELPECSDECVAGSSGSSVADSEIGRSRGSGLRETGSEFDGSVVANDGGDVSDAEDGGQPVRRRSPEPGRHALWSDLQTEERAGVAGKPESGLGMLVDGLPVDVVRWSPEPEGVPRVAIGVKDRVNKLKGLGNAILPQVAFEILREIRLSL